MIARLPFLTGALCTVHVFILLGTASDQSPTPTAFPVREYWYNATLDHFNFAKTTRSFPLRFFVNDEHWQVAKSGPILFYCGNEGDIVAFVNSSGQAFEFAKSLGAMLVYAEHLHYGASMPFGEDSGQQGKIEFLSVEQALADFSELLLHVRKAWSVLEEVAVVAFGGSYGANLAYWWRARQPNLVAGALAASATPQKHLLRDSNAFARIWTDVYRNVSGLCPEIVYHGFLDMQKSWATPAGRKGAADALGLCGSEELDFDTVYGWLVDGLETMVQYGYPYPTEFYAGRPLPGEPYRAACEAMLPHQLQPLVALRAAAGVFYNYTGQAGPCFDLSGPSDTNTLEGRRHTRPRPRRPSGVRALATSEGQPTLDAWGYQCCTEVYQPMPTLGLSGGDMELPSSPNFTAYSEDCEARYGVVPRPGWEEMWFWGPDVHTLTNVFFTNGQLDPWRSAAISKLPVGTRPGADVQIRLLEHSAHHLDLRSSHPLDPPSVTAVRLEQLEAVKRWAGEWRRSHAARSQPAVMI
ncbi:unnamed protein product [Polarella glacialis]|uniref:Uncharacterized protein n=1 Tax=Polarella glacialis TaxID=89957 RepID=A0A813L583_POLGL|nr:unnamed protein product [Polarella glacialis]